MRFSFQNDLAPQLDDKLGEVENFRAWKHRISLVLEETELDTYISGEVPVPKGDEAKALTYEDTRLIIREEKLGATGDQTLTIQRRSLKR